MEFGEAEVIVEIAGFVFGLQVTSFLFLNFLWHVFGLQVTSFAVRLTLIRFVSAGGYMVRLPH